MITKSYLTIVLFMVILGSCATKDSNDKSKNLKVNNIFEQQRSAVLGKKINSIVTILGDSINAECKVILLYDGYDCETCIDVGYEMLKRIDDLAGRQKAYVITTSLNIGRDQAKNEYFNYVYYDEHDIIRKELKYIYTPVLLKLDSAVKVEEIFFPNYQRDLKNETRFVNLSSEKY